jgi:putative endonuclease
MSSHSCWYVYIVECADGTFYTGVTTDVLRRVAEHNGEDANANRGAKYTKSRRPVTLVYHEERLNRSSAQQREYTLRKLSVDAKIKLLRQ